MSCIVLPSRNTKYGKPKKHQLFCVFRNKFSYLDDQIVHEVKIEKYIILRKKHFIKIKISELKSFKESNKKPVITIDCIFFY